MVLRRGLSALLGALLSLPTPLSAQPSDSTRADVVALCQYLKEKGRTFSDSSYSASITEGYLSQTETTQYSASFPAQSGPLDTLVGIRYDDNGCRSITGLPCI
ncbi:MAG: hypothetical protein AABX37_04380, partial [Nanoarchaeota archaeon]